MALAHRLPLAALLLMWSGVATAKPPRHKARPRKAPAPVIVPAPSEEGPSVDRSSPSWEDVDVSAVPVPKAPRRGAASAPAPTSDRLVSGDDGGHFRFRAHLAFAQYQYAETGAAPFAMKNLFLSGGVEISRPFLGGWILGAAVDSPIFSLESAGATNFGPLYARFSLGHTLRLADAWDGEVYLSYLFETPVGRRNGAGFTRTGGVQASFRARWHVKPERALELDGSAAFLDSRQDGFKTGDRYLGLQATYWFEKALGTIALGPFVAVDETKAEFPDKRTAGGRIRVGLSAEL